MKEYIPQYLRSLCELQEINIEKDGGYEINLKLKVDNDDLFYLFKSQNKVSPKYIEYIKYLNTLETKYKNHLKNRYQFASRCDINGRVLWGYSYNGDFVQLEDITDITNAILQDSQPIIIKAISLVNGKKFEVFNSDKFGYDALTKQKGGNHIDLKFTKSKCRKCGCDKFTVFIRIHNTGKQDLLHNQPCAEITEQNWTNAFDWISVDKRCSNCGHCARHWFEMETM